MMRFIRRMLWVALIGTTAFFFFLLHALPSVGDVAMLIEIFVTLALATVWWLLWPRKKTEEVTELDILLKRLAASRK